METPECGAPIIPAILCGGSGTRLWPLSREMHPKQFIDLGDGETLFSRTLARTALLPGSAPPICICNEKHRFYVETHMKDGQIVLEPQGRNTAPAAALAALLAHRRDPDALLLIVPSDHHFPDPQAFAAGVEASAQLAEAGKVVTYGIAPTAPATGFGYIRAGAPLLSGFAVARFVEKPALPQAQAMLAEGGYFWNAGIFLVRPEVYLTELASFAPDILASAEAALAGVDASARLVRPQEEEYCSCRSDSIDYAIMEHTEKAAMFPLSCEWNDMGSWEAFYRSASRDNGGNAATGRVMTRDVHNSYIHSCGRLIAAVGVDNLAIVETADAVLVASRDQAEAIRGIATSLKAEGADEYLRHRQVYKPWGSYETLATGDRFQVKRIIVNPGQSISLQMHHHRAEHWIVVSGTAEITNGDETRLYTENQSTYIPVGKLHKLHNPGIIPLCLIEIQSGPYLGEDDIVRLEDPYGRKKGE